MENRSKLVRMRITNLGCVGPDGLDVEFDNIVCLVGANNSGKSTVLRAYEAAVGAMELAPDEFNIQSDGKPATVELWVHIPEGAENVDAKWKEPKDGLLLVRSKWEWPRTGGKPTRTTWDPQEDGYAEDGKAAGLDTVFNSRLPKPFRIGSLDNPTEEHRKLLDLVLEPIKAQLESLIDDENSELRKKIADMRTEAEKPVEAFRADLTKVRERVSRSYQRVFSAAEIQLNVSLGEIAINPSAALLKASHVAVKEQHGETRWSQQGTGSQRTLFWSMLEVRSELNRVAEERKAKQKLLKEKEREIQKKEKERSKLTKADAIQKKDSEIESLKSELANLNADASMPQPTSSNIFLPGYMLLIDEPETALHPSAVRAAKEHLYSLAAESGWQVMLSTHHPAFVDPLKDHTTIVRLHRPDAHEPPNIYRTDEMTFIGDEKANLKSLLAFDTSVAEMFFGSKVIIVEGDTEFAAFTEVMNDDVINYPIDGRPLLIRARGKATIPTLVRMLAHFKVDFSVLHDIDSPKATDGARKNGAYSVNETIKDTVRNARLGGVKIIHRCSCPNFEQHHGMTLPSKDKPFETWRAVHSNDHVKKTVRQLLDELCAVPTIDAETHADDGKHYENKLKQWVKDKANGDPAYSFDKA